MARLTLLLGKFQNLQDDCDRLIKKLSSKPPSSYTIIAVGKYSNGDQFAWGTSGRIAAGSSSEIQIVPQAALAKGLIIFCIGGTVELAAVRVGNREQNPWSDGGAPFCTLRDEVDPGVYISLQLRSKESVYD